MSLYDRTIRDPVNITAARILSGGIHYNAKGDVGQPHWEICPPLKPVPPFCHNLEGKRVGRLTVVGYYKSNPARWVVRCDCGDFELRKGRALFNPENFGDRCHKCRHVAYERRAYELAKTGREIDTRTL